MTGYSLDIDASLLHAIAEGDEQAFAVLFQKVVPQLEPAVKKWVGDEDALQDVIQESFIRVWMNRDKLPGLDKPVNWIFRVAANECFTWLNKRALRASKLKHVQAENTEGRYDAFEIFSEKETGQLIANAVGRLPEQKRIIYEMSRQQGLKTAEIAERLNLSDGHVRNALSSSLKFIREYLIAAGKIMAITSAFLK